MAGARRFGHLFGPTLLAAVPDDPSSPLWNSTTDCLDIEGVDPTTPASWLVQATPDPAGLRFTSSRAPGVTFMPYYEVQDQLMTVYPCFLQ